MSWNKKIKERIRKNKIKACFLLTFLVFLALSLFSYHPQDSSFNFVGLSTKVSNYCGFIGASLADGIYQLFGLAGAWLLVIGGLGLASRLLTRPLSENHLSSFLFFLVFLLSCISLAELHFPLMSFFNGEISLGGVFGQGLSASLKPLLGGIGTGVILWSGFIALTLFYGQIFFPFLLSFPKKLLFFLFIKGAYLWKKRAVLARLNPLLLLKAVLELGTKLFKGLFFPFKSPPLASFWRFFKTKALLDRSQSSALHPSQTLETEKSGELSSSFSFSDSQTIKSSRFQSPVEDSQKTKAFSLNKKNPLRGARTAFSNLSWRNVFFSKSKSEASPSQDSTAPSNSKTGRSASSPNESLSYGKRELNGNILASLSPSQPSGSAPYHKTEKSPPSLNSDHRNQIKSSAVNLDDKNKEGLSLSSHNTKLEELNSPVSSESLPKKVWSSQSIPPIDILMDAPSSSRKMNSKDVEELSKKLLDKLQQFSIKGEIKAVKTGPALVLFEYKPEDHVKVSQIRKMESDLSLALSSESIRIIAPIPGRDVVGIEASMPYREMVYLKQLLREKEFSKADLPLVLGRRADNKAGVKDLARIPHLLVAGTTGSGKSMFIISFISSLLFRHSPESLKLLLIDPKQVDLSSFKEIPHLSAPIISSAPSAVQSLFWAIQEMEKRYRSLAEFKVRDHKSFNEKTKKLSHNEKNRHRIKNEEIDQENSYYFEPLPLFCIVIEEFGDLMADPSVRRSIENAVVRLAQKARASGIHLVLAMQSPRKDVVTGLIKTNIPGRISFKVASGTDSRVILDDTGAERLLSHGDMLFLEPGSLKATRYHGPFMRDQEVSSIVSYWKSQSPEDSFYNSDLMRVLDKKNPSSFKPKAGSLKQDAMYDEILDFVRSCDVISASLLQRKFQIGYPRAGRIIQDLFDKGQIGPPRGSKPREVLISK